MKIDKLFHGLKRIENGDYVLEGDLISEDTIEVELDDRFVVRGKVISKKSIIVRCGIKAGWGIKAGEGIEAKAFLDVKKRIFAGVSVYHTSENCKKFIKCAELRNGEVAFGDLMIEKPKIELAPCPFCGRENPALLSAEEIDKKYEDEPTTYTVCCEMDNGGCGACGGYRDTKEEAVEAWNKRG